jgi:hypothetical protein
MASTFRVALFANGAFAPSIGIPGMGSERLAAAVDLDRDGDVDLVGGRCIYYARGPITRDPLTRMPWSYPESQCLDVEGDGDLDVGFRLGVDFFRNAADATFAPAMVAPPAAPPGTRWERGGFAGDFDGDGDVDLLVRHFQGTQLLGMRLLQNSGGGLADAGPAGPPGVDFHPLREWESDHMSNLPVDLDRDGDLDLLTFTRDGSTWHVTRIWANDGAGVFRAAGELTGLVPQQAADLDGDGVLDLVMVVGQSNSASVGPLAWCRGTGGFGFAGPVLFPGPAVLQAHVDRVAVVDVEGDGDLDVLGGSIGVAGVTGVQLNDGAGRFTLVDALPRTEPIQALRRVALADADGDGVRDLMVGTPLHGRGTLWFRGLAAGGFAPPVHQLVEPAALRDFDGDGDLDVLHASGEVMRGTRFHGPAAGSLRQYGAGAPGTGGVVPWFGARGPVRGNLTIEKRVVGAVGGTIAAWVLGTQPLALADTPVVGTWLLVAPSAVAAGVPIGGAPGVAGAGTWTLSWVVPPAAAGLAVYEQFFVLDAGAPHGISATNGLEARFGAPR